MTNTTYTTKRAAIAGARRALAKAGVENALSQVHFNVHLREDSDEWYWAAVDLTPAERKAQVTKPSGKSFPDADPGSTRELADQKAARQSRAAKQAIAETTARTPPTPPPTPPVAPAERGRNPKRAQPAKIADRPRSGSQQRAAYELLTSPDYPEGIEAQTFCDLMNPWVKPGATPWTPANTWGFLNYLLVSQKGYGLSFDGTRFRLLVPKDERDPVARKADPLPPMKAK